MATEILSGYGTMGYAQQTRGVSGRTISSGEDTCGIFNTNRPGPPSYLKTPQQEKIVDNQVLPDISLSRVLKWAVVFIIALALGKKAWALFGEKITANLHKSLDEIK